MVYHLVLFGGVDAHYALFVDRKKYFPPPKVNALLLEAHVQLPVAGNTWQTRALRCI